MMNRKRAESIMESSVSAVKQLHKTIVSLFTSSQLRKGFATNYLLFLFKIYFWCFAFIMI